MYTFDDYERDLEILKSLGINTAYKERREEVVVTSNCALESSTIFEDGRIVQYGPKSTVLKKNSGENKISAVNFQYLKRSNFSRKKFKSTLKSEKSKGEEDDFAGLFIELWIQFEYEYRKRFYENFIPYELKTVLNILKETKLNKRNCLEAIALDKKDVTFGLVNEVIYAVEKGFGRGEKSITWRLSKIFNSQHLSFFKKYSINSSFARLNRDVRNVIMHENRVLGYGGYRDVCAMLFDRPGLNEWCNYERPGLFTDYLKMLPETDEEKDITALEGMIRKIKMGAGLGNDKGQIPFLEDELKDRKNNLTRI